MRKLLVFFIFISILMFSCDQSVNMLLGVGQALDSESPKISITSPENGIYVNKSNITITGKCSDNVGVTRINAQAGIAGVTSTVTKNVNLHSVREGSWSVTFEADELERGLNLWRSGLKVTFTFTCYDAAGNTVVEHLFLYVDVELPTVIINRPEVRFTENEKIEYENNPESFKVEYDINKFEKVNSFVNKEFTIKGYVDDDYSVKSTYINIYNATKKKQVAVTPIIFKDGTYITGGNGGSDGVIGNSQSWEFKLDSTLICPTEGWCAIEVVTQDEAGNEKKQFVDKYWMYINQAADIPRNNFTSFSPGFKLNAGNVIAGNGFDDDGMKEVWIKIVPESEADAETPYTEWEAFEDTSHIIKKCADFTSGVQLGNWSLKIPGKAGNYIIYAIPVDINNVAPQTPYEGIYASYFSVASEEDPVVGIDAKFRGSTIVEKTAIKGYFYDNNGVTKMNVTCRADDKTEKTIELYDSTKSNHKIKITEVDTEFQLSTGQIVTKYIFDWEFNPADLPAYKTLSLNFKVDDADKNYGEDAITIYGDSERPAFVGAISPANNSNVDVTNVFTGTVSDNVDVVSVTIKAVGSSSWKEDVVCELGDSKKVDGKTVRTFTSREILPAEFGGWSDREFTITAKDAVGNEASQIITLKGDKNKPEIAFVDDMGGVEKSGNYVTTDKILNVRITPKSFDDGTQREIKSATYLTGTQKSEPLSIKKDGNNYTAQIEVSKLGNISGDVTLQVTATDDAENEGQGTIYFIVDNEEPSALAITSPLLKNKAEIENLADDVDSINENDISFYQNGIIQLKGTIADNYKIDKTVLNICDISGKSVLQMTLTADEKGKLSVAAVGDKESAFINGEYSGIPGNFTIKLDTTKFADGDYVLKTTAYDAAGNSASWGNSESEEMYFKVLQDADKPRITFNIDDGATIYPGSVLKGLLIDDDAIGRVRYILEKDEFNNAKEMFDAPNDKNVHELENVKQYTRQDWMLEDISGIGMYHLYMLAEDIYGTESKLYTLEITVTSPDSAFIKSISSKVGNGGSFGNGYYSGNVKIMVGAAAGGESKLKYMYYKITAANTDTNNREVDHTATPTKNFVFTPSGNLGGWHKYEFSESEAARDDIELEFDSRLFVENNTETITVEVRCEDGQAISAAVKDKISIDNEGVSLRVTSPLSNVSVNKTFEIAGSCNDRGAGVGDIYIGYMKDSAVQNITLEDITNNLCGEPTLDKWKKIENDGISWEHEYVSTLINNSASAENYKVQIAATDVLGNIGVITHDIKIDQDGDRPIIRCQNLPLKSDVASWCKVSSIYGTVSDDDGGISQFYISEDGGKNWSDNCYQNGSWMHSFATDGEKELYFKVVDGKNTEFISKVSNILETPKIVDSEGSEFGYTKIDDTGFTIKVDTNNPSLTSIYYNKKGKSDFDGNISETDWDSAFIDKVFGGNENKIYLLFGASDANGIDVEKTTLECSTVNLDISIVGRDTVGNNEYFVYEVDISGVNNSYLTFKASVTDNSGLPTATTFQVNIDNEAPSVVITNYSDNAEIYGSNENLIKGSTGDAHKTKSVEYAFSITSTEPDSGEYKHLEDSEGNNFAAWEAKFKENALNDEIKRLYGIDDFEKDNYDLYFWVKATDTFGNVSDAISVCLNVIPNGDKPTVYFSYPTGGEILGGTIRITGTAQVLTGEVTDVSIQMDSSYDGKTFISDNEKKVDSVSKTNWSLTINKDRNLMGNVAVRAKATSSTGKITLSEIVAFQIDSKVPLFGQSEELTLVQYDNNGKALKRKPYEADTWVSGEGWSLEGSVEDDSGIAEIKNDVLSGNVGTIEMTEEKNFGSNKGHSFKIPLETRDFGNISFILKAIDKSGDNPASNTASIAINYDNMAPTFEAEELSTSDTTRTKIENRDGIYRIDGTFEEISSGRDNQSGFERIAMYFTRKIDNTITYIIDPMLQKGDDGESNRYDIDDKEENLISSDTDGMYWRKATALSTENSEMNIDSIPGNVRPGGLCKINETIYRIANVDSNTISVNGTLPTLTNTPVYFAIAQVIDNMTIESGKTTFYGDSNTITPDDDDQMVEGVYRSGASYTWTVSINSENILDGDTDIHFVAFDKAGNCKKQTYYTSVANNAPRIAGVTFAMDNNINGTIEENEKHTEFANIYNATVPKECVNGVEVNGKSPIGDKVTELNLPLESSKPLMTIKGKTRITAKIVGGNSGLQWRWKINGYGWSDLKNLSNVHSEGDVLRADLDMEISQLEFLAKEIKNEENKKLQIEIWDKTEGKTPGKDSKCATINILADTGLFDTTAPTVEIKPFYWNSETDNSLYQNSRANGHIELEGNLTSAIKGKLGDEPKVSGKITIEGTASDNVLVNALYMTIKGFKGENEFNVADRSDDGTWTFYDNMANDGWACEISDDTFTKDSNTIKWKFHWDTSKVAGVAKKDVVVKARVEDKGKAGLSTNGNTVVYGTPNTSETDTYQMDVVPYIKGIYRAKTVNTNRTRSGAVPILRNEANNYIEGFNLGSSITAAITTAADGSGNSYNLSPAYSDGVATYTVPNKVKDGYLNVKVNGVSSLNNINDDSKEYNKEVNPYLEETTYWSDNRSVRVWKNESGDYFPGSESPVYPVMSMGSDGTLYASFSNYSNANVYYSYIGATAATIVFHSYDPPEETDIHISETDTVNVAYSANYHKGSDKNWIANSNDAGGLYVYDKNATSKTGGSGNYRFNKFELFYHDKMLQQFKNIRVKRSNTANTGLVHVAYYDKVTSSIHYSNSPGNGNQKASDNEYAWVNIDGSSDSHDTGTYHNNEKSIVLANSNFEGTKRSSGTGESVGLALTKSGYPVVVYYDTDKMILKVARATQENPKGNTAYWEVQDVLATDDVNYKSMVDYITCDIDTNGNLHIAFQNGKNQLCYVKSTNASEYGSASYTFGQSVVIASGATWIDLTLKETTPYISYLSKINSKDGMNIAFYDSTFDTDFNGTANGEWETMVAPLNYKVSNVRSCIEVHPTTGADWEAAVGFTPGDNYRVAYYIGSGTGH